MTDRRNPVHAALTDLAMQLLGDRDFDNAGMVAHVRDLYDGMAKPKPRKRREKSIAGYPKIPPLVTEEPPE